MCASMLVRNMYVGYLLWTVEVDESLPDRKINSMRSTNYSFSKQHSSRESLGSMLPLVRRRFVYRCAPRGKAGVATCCGSSF